MVSGSIEMLDLDPTPVLGSNSEGWVLERSYHGAERKYAHSVSVGFVLAPDLPR